jgi:hypothetical protein
MFDKSDKPEAARKAIQPALPRRPSYERVAEDIDKWANSPGLQKPN